MTSESESSDDLLSQLDLGDEPGWSTPTDLARVSTDALFRSQSLGRPPRSAGVLRVVDGPPETHTARIDRVGQLLRDFQRLVSATGSALEGERSLRGQLSRQVRALTQLRLVASPLPGSIVLEMEPEGDSNEEVYPGGQVPMVGADPLPLIDRSLEALIALITAGLDAEPGDPGDRFVGQLEELGPRTASALRDFIDPMASHGLQIDLNWETADEPAKRVRLDQPGAERIARLVETQRLEAEPVTLEGRLHTISRTRVWDLETEDGDLIRLSKGNLPETIFSSLTVGLAVRVDAEVMPQRQPGGETVYRYTALRISPLTELDT